MADLVSEQITQLLGRMGEGKEVLDDLMPLVYDALQAVAHRQLLRETPGHTLNTTALVHEAYLKLVDQRHANWKNRAHFLAVASIAMRRILVSEARKRRRLKRGGASPHLTWNDDRGAGDGGRSVDILALDECLERLAKLSQRSVQVVECRFFGGLTVEETASALDVSPITVKRDWQAAKAWLRREIASDQPHSSS